MFLMKKDLANLESLSRLVVEWSTNFLHKIDQHPVAASHNPTPIAAPLTIDGIGAEAAFAEFTKNIAPELSGSAGPRYLGFVTGGVTPAAMLGDWLTAAVDQNVMVPGDSISTAVELQVLAWLRSLFEIDSEFEGVLTSGATSSNLLGIITARQHAGEVQGLDIAADGISGAEIEVFSACPHASIKKVLAIAGIGRNKIIEVPALPKSEEMDVTALTQMLKESTSPGKIVIASAGTVTGTAFDDLKQISSLCKTHNAWLHVDGAFGLFSRLVPELKPLTEGINGADSITCDGHKWLNVPYDCGIFFTKHPAILQRTCSVTAPYLDITNELPTLMDRGIENSRRFRALPIWMSLKAYGKEGYSELIRRNCDQARLLAEWIEASADYELLTKCELNVVVLRPTENSKDVSQLLSEINQTGLVYLTPGVWFGTKGIRAAFSNWRTTTTDVETVCEVLSRSILA